MAFVNFPFQQTGELMRDRSSHPGTQMPYPQLRGPRGTGKSLSFVKSHPSRVLTVSLFAALMFGPISAQGRTPARYAVDVYFAPNSAVLSSSEVERVLEPVRTKCGGSFALYFAVGHADSSESGDKMLLSTARAAAVAIHILRAFPELGPVTWFVGKSDMQPAAGNGTAKDRTKNRRTEIEMVCNPSERTP